MFSGNGCWWKLNVLVKSKYTRLPENWRQESFLKLGLKLWLFRTQLSFHWNFTNCVIHSFIPQYICGICALTLYKDVYHCQKVFIDLFPICLCLPAFQNITNWAEMKLYLLWRTVKSVITSCYTRLATIGAARRDAGRLSESAWEALHLGSRLAGPSQSGGGGKFSSQVVKKRKSAATWILRGIRRRENASDGSVGGWRGAVAEEQQCGQGRWGESSYSLPTTQKSSFFQVPFRQI